VTAMMVMVIRGEQILRHRVLFVIIKYFHIIYRSFSLHMTKMCISPHAPSRKRQLTVMFTGHSGIVGRQWGTCYVSHFWHL
jgi:predicted metal-dependent hydrolase